MTETAEDLSDLGIPAITFAEQEEEKPPINATPVAPPPIDPRAGYLNLAAQLNAVREGLVYLEQHQPPSKYRPAAIKNVTAAYRQVVAMAVEGLE